jgi:hypothetical protein
MTDSLSTMRRLPWLPMVLACLVIALFVGCSETNPTGTLQGKVTLDDAPYTDGAVVFMSPDSGQAGSADIQADGTFRIEDPLPVGSYVVFIAPKSAESEEGMDQPVEVSLDDSVPAKYLSETTSDIMKDIVAGANDVTVELKSG